MRAVVQRVSSAAVKVIEEDKAYLSGEISAGLLVFVGITDSDDDSDMKYIIDKLIGLRIFEDEQHKMNLSVRDINGSILLVSQFTLYGDARKGKRPSFTDAARPDHAVPLYEKMKNEIEKEGIRLRSGIFGANMEVQITNDGPVTILLDSKKQF